MDLLAHDVVAEPPPLPPIPRTPLLTALWPIMDDLAERDCVRFDEKQNAFIAASQNDLDIIHNAMGHFESTLTLPLDSTSLRSLESFREGMNATVIDGQNRKSPQKWQFKQRDMWDKAVNALSRSKRQSAFNPSGSSPTRIHSSCVANFVNSAACTSTRQAHSSR